MGGPGAGLAIALENLFPPLSSEVILPLTGFAAGQGVISLASALLWTTLGSVAGAAVLYWLGLLFGRERIHALWARLPPVRGSDLERTEAWFVRHGTKAVLFGRMVPVFRSLISVPAGLERMPLPVFLGLTAVGSLAWNSVLVMAGYWLGDQWDVGGRTSASCPGSPCSWYWPRSCSTSPCACGPATDGTGGGAPPDGGGSAQDHAPAHTAGADGPFRAPRLRPADPALPPAGGSGVPPAGHRRHRHSDAAHPQGRGSARRGGDPQEVAGHRGTCPVPVRGARRDGSRSHGARTRRPGSPGRPTVLRCGQYPVEGGRARHRLVRIPTGPGPGRCRTSPP